MGHSFPLKIALSHGDIWTPIYYMIHRAHTSATIELDFAKSLAFYST